jgi:hypothetical protein
MAFLSIKGLIFQLDAVFSLNFSGKKKRKNYAGSESHFPLNSWVNPVLIGKQK